MLNRCLKWIKEDFRHFKRDTRKFKNAFLLMCDSIKEIFDKLFLRR